MKNLDTKKLSYNQFIVVIIMIAVVVWVVGLIVSKAVFDTISFNNRLIGRKRAAASQLQENLNNVDALEEAFSDLETRGPNTVRVLHAMPEQMEVPSLGSRLENLANSTGVRLETFTVSSSSTTPTTEEVTAPANVGGPQPQPSEFIVGFGGTYAGIIAAINALEHEITPIRIKELRMTGSESEAIAQVTIVVYSQPATEIIAGKETVQ
jgi:Tfp pilus assembly protein PilO